MATQISAIIPREIHFRTQTNVDWLDGLLVYAAGSGGVVAGATNVGTGTLVVNSVSPSTPLGAHIVTITSVGGITRLTTQDPAGNVTAQGAVGAPVYAGGITFTVTAGSKAFEADDAFAISVLPAPVDLSGLRGVLQARKTATAGGVAFSADSAPLDGSVATIALGGPAGTVAMSVPRAFMDANRFQPGTYLYDIIAIDAEAGRTAVMFYGTIEHVYGIGLIP